MDDVQHGDGGAKKRSGGKARAAGSRARVAGVGIGAPWLA